MSLASEFFIRIGETSAAERLLNAILKSDGNAPEPAVALARRRRALVTRNSQGTKTHDHGNGDARTGEFQEAAD